MYIYIYIYTRTRDLWEPREEDLLLLAEEDLLLLEEEDLLLNGFPATGSRTQEPLRFPGLSKPPTSDALYTFFHIHFG